MSLLCRLLLGSSLRTQSLYRELPPDPLAVVVAQHSFLSHLHFSVGHGRAALEDVGNQADTLEINGGEYGIAGLGGADRRTLYIGARTSIFAIRTVAPGASR